MTLEASFNQQAKHFDQRAGINDQDCQKIIEALDKFYQKTTQKKWLEIGAGTGQIGALALNKTDHYVGIDISEEMLHEFRKKANNIELYQADGNKSWPLADKSVSMSFSSRTVHLLSADHVLNELKRVHFEGYFLIGRIRRERSENIKDTMKVKMRDILQFLGYQSRKGEENRKRLLDLLCERGAERIKPIVATSWDEVYSPHRSIESWMSKDGLAGQEISSSIKEECIKKLSDWASDRYGSINHEEKVQQTYIIEGVNLNTLCSQV